MRPVTPGQPLYGPPTVTPSTPPADWSPPPPSRLRPRWELAVPLFLLTLFCATTLGAGWYLFTRTDVTTDLIPFLTPGTVRRVWTDPELLAVGLRFSLPVLLILLCHELGHYLACRRYGLPATLPYFLPLPVALGTLGAFIRIRAPIRSRRQLLDVGAAGPLAGFVALLPFLIYGVANSTPAPIEPAPVEPAGGPGELLLLLPGRCLAMEAVTRVFHGPLPEGWVLDFHPFALAAWVGLLATALNLLPLGQLDGGHVFYAAAPAVQRRAAPWLLGALLLAGLYWRGWLFWGAVVLIIGPRHPPVADVDRPLSGWRLAVALACLLLFAGSFMPLPLQLVPVGG